MFIGLCAVYTDLPEFEWAEWFQTVCDILNGPAAFSHCDGS